MVTQGVGVIGLTDVDGPGSDGSDMQGEVLLVGCRGQCEGVILGAAEDLAGDSHPLAGLVVKVHGPLEFQHGDTCRRNRHSYEI